MLNRELRREERLVLTHQPKGQLLIHLNDDCIPARAVRDISTTGISVVFSGVLDNDTVVTLEYRSLEIDVKVEGTVIWSRDEHPAGDPERTLTVLGIKLVNPTFLLAAMLGS